MSESNKLEKKASLDENNNPKQKCTTTTTRETTSPHIYCEIDSQNATKQLIMTNDASILECVTNSDSASEDEPLINFNAEKASTVNQDRLKNNLSYLSNIFGSSTANSSSSKTAGNKCASNDHFNDTSKCQPIDSKNKSLVTFFPYTYINQI